MSFREKDVIREFTPVRFLDGRISFPVLQSLLYSKASEYGIPVAFAMDEMISGGLLSSSSDSMMVLFHPDETNNYMKVGFTIRDMGNTSVISPVILAFNKPVMGTTLVTTGQKVKQFNEIVSDRNVINSIKKSGLSGLADVGSQAASFLFGDNKRAMDRRKDWESIVSLIVESIGD